jgi:serine/threonine-protein kinase HipA
MSHFQTWADKAGTPWRAIKPHLNDVLRKARMLWPEVLKALPIDDAHKDELRAHRGNIQEDF